MGFSNRLPLRPTYWTLVQPFGHTEEGSSITSHGERRRFKYLTNTIWHYTKPRSISQWIIKPWIEYLFTKLQRILWWMYKLYAVDLFFLMILSNCWSILTSRQATGAGAKCLSVPRALFLTPWWAGSDEQVDVLTFWRFLSPSLPTRDGGWKKSGPPMRFTSVTNYISYSNGPQFELMMFAINFYHCYEAIFVPGLVQTFIKTLASVLTTIAWKCCFNIKRLGCITLYWLTFLTDIVIKVSPTKIQNQWRPCPPGKHLAHNTSNRSIWVICRDELGLWGNSFFYQLLVWHDTSPAWWPHPKLPRQRLQAGSGEPPTPPHHSYPSPSPRPWSTFHQVWQRKTKLNLPDEHWGVANAWQDVCHLHTGADQLLSQGIAHAWDC